MAFLALDLLVDVVVLGAAVLGSVSASAAAAAAAAALARTLAMALAHSDVPAVVGADAWTGAGESSSVACAATGERRRGGDEVSSCSESSISSMSWYGDDGCLVVAAMGSTSSIS